MKKYLCLILCVSLLVPGLTGCHVEKAGGTAQEVSDRVEPAIKISKRDEKNLIEPNHKTYDPETTLTTYYEKWKNGNHRDESGKRLATPGYIQSFLLPEPQPLPWEGEADKSPGPNQTGGAVVLMVPNGTPDELPGDYCVSTDEAMGYGLIVSALMGDKEVFDQLLRVVLYYQNYNTDRTARTGSPWHKDLTTWAIPAQRGADWFETEEFKVLSEDAKAQWRDGGIRYQPKYLEGTAIPESVMLGEKRSESTCGGSATDGEIDIAYALYLAHKQWGSKESDGYLVLARARFKAIFDEIVEPYGHLAQGDENLQFLPTGDYRVNYTIDNTGFYESLTRPCDFMTAEFKTYFEDTGDVRAKDLIDNLYQQAGAVADAKTGLVPDFARFNKESKLEPAPAETANEWMSEMFYMNSARFPFRVAMDTYHFGDQRGFKATEAIVNFMLETYDFTTPQGHQDFPPAIHNLSGEAQAEGLWTNPVLNSALYSACAMSGDPKYQEFINLGWASLASGFDSRYNDYDQNGLGLEPGHSGYFSDTWRLMGMLMMSGNWFKP